MVLSTKYQPKDNQWCTLYTLTLSTKYERGDDQTTTIVYCERYVQICACNYVAPCIVVFVYIDVINNIRARAQSTLVNAQWSRQYCKTIVCWEQCVTTSEGYQQDTKDNQWCTRLSSILWRIWVNMCLHPVTPCIVVFRYIDVINNIQEGGQSNPCTRHNSILWRIWCANVCTLSHPVL